MKDILDLFKKFFGVAFQAQTYLNLLYLALAFPLGVFYFIFLIIGLTTGLSTAVLLIGIVILVGTLAVAWALAAFERQQAVWLLRVKVGPMWRAAEAPGFWSWLKAYIGNPVTWTGLVYLCLKFPIGIVVFCVMVTLLAFSAALLLAPLTFWWLPIVFFFWRIDTLPQALALFAAGLLVTPISLHILNFLAYSLGQLARLMLGALAGEPQAPATPAGRASGGACVLPFAALALFACAILMLCSAASWPLFFGRHAQREREQPTVYAAASATPTLRRPTAAPTATAVATTQPAPTQIPTATASATPTETATRTATAIPPTSTPAATANATLTSSPTFTPTAAGPDPLAGAGSVLFEETFAPAKYYWGTGEGKFSSIQVKDGALNLAVKEAKHVAWTFSGAPAKADFYFSGTVTATACTSGDYFGLVFRAQDDSHLLLFGISCDGGYQVAQNIGGALQPLAAPAMSPAIRPGPGAVNQLGVRAVGKQLDLYANGQFLATVEAGATRKGLFGVYASSAKTPNLTVAFSGLKAWEIK